MPQISIVSFDVSEQKKGDSTLTARIVAAAKTSDRRMNEARRTQSDRTVIHCGDLEMQHRGNAFLPL